MEPTASPLGPIGLVLPTFPQGSAPSWFGSADPTANAASALATLCQQAEQLGADALWACDHQFWHTPCLECMVALTVAATATERASVGTCVMQLPLRQAPAVAKQAASLQTLSGGRVVLGVGVGSHPGEYVEAGVDYHTRGHLLDAGIVELRRSWSSGQGVAWGDVELTGPARYRQLPAPAPIPVWVGGSSEAALCRAAALADGWMPLFLTPAAYGEAVERLAKEVAAAGRAADEVTPSIVLFVHVADDPVAGQARGTEWMGSHYGIPAKAFGRHLVNGTADEVAGVVASFFRAGAEHVAIYVTEDQPLAQFERLLAALPAAGLPARG
jgi:alkanesulfonate monooxygenase SsuD/methylene tetrahydromethanopterin reductase-like flavin-dependent oxidoreductase (luciferase family)